MTTQARPTTPAPLVTLVARPRRTAATPRVEHLHAASDLTAAYADTLARTAA
jgi:hypothetical protein